MNKFKYKLIKNYFKQQAMDYSARLLKGEGINNESLALEVSEVKEFFSIYIDEEIKLCNQPREYDKRYCREEIRNIHILYKQIEDDKKIAKIITTQLETLNKIFGEINKYIDYKSSCESNNGYAYLQIGLSNSRILSLYTLFYFLYVEGKYYEKILNPLSENLDINNILLVYELIYNINSRAELDAIDLS